MNKRLFHHILLVPILSLLYSGCGITPVSYEENDMDAAGVIDTSLIDPTYRISSHPDLDSFDRTVPVIICVHGYGACTYEWQELRDYAIADRRVRTSLVLLGGHGTNIEEFEKSRWQDWQTPIIDEFDTLTRLNFTNISFAASSTGATLLLEMIGRNFFRDYSVKPAHFFLIDPIIVPSNKLLTMVNVVGPILGNAPLEEDRPEIEKRHWYRNRPSETLEELYSIASLVRSKLQSGMKLPAGSTAKVYKSTTDQSADPVSALLIYKGLTDSDGHKIEVQMVDSKLHVFTRLAGRTPASVSEKDRQNQQNTFKEIIDRTAQ